LHGFEAGEWDRLTPAERIRYCGLMAEEARALAEIALPRMKEIYLKLAGQWLDLAAEISRSADAGH